MSVFGFLRANVVKMEWFFFSESNFDVGMVEQFCDEVCFFSCVYEGVGVFLFGLISIAFWGFGCGCDGLVGNPLLCNMFVIVEVSVLRC
jgi:hypothetical protein